MSATSPTLHMLCGKVASGKSTLAAQLARQPGTVLVSEDAWLNALFSEEMKTIADYVRCSKKLCSVMGPHLSSLLTAGVSVVLDFQANTMDTRKWMRGVFESAQADHVLHVLDISDETCLTRLRDRNTRGDHPFTVTDAQFAQISAHYAAPTPEEGFNLVFHSD